jgi:hypothetical protein
VYESKKKKKAQEDQPQASESVPQQNEAVVPQMEQKQEEEASESWEDIDGNRSVH